MTQNDPEMTQKLPSFRIVDLSGKMRRKLGQKLGHLLGSENGRNDPEKSDGFVRVCEASGYSGYWFGI